MSYSNNSLEARDIEQIQEKIHPFINKTPIFRSNYFDRSFGGRAFFKGENFQKIGAFKMRGAVNAILNLSTEEKERGVVAHSSGNHAQAVALAANFFGVKAVIIMPSNSSPIKVAAVKEYGAELFFCEPNIRSRETFLKKVVDQRGCTEIHPFDDYSIIGGQATVAKELITEVEDLDFVVAPVGGGGLLSGTALSAHYFGKNIKVIGAEPCQVDDAYWSIKNGEIMPPTEKKTIADGLRTNLGSKTFPIIQKFVEEIIRVEEDEIIKAMKFLMERMKLVVEPSGAVSVAAVLKEKDIFRGANVGIVLSGGNVDLLNLPF